MKVLRKQELKKALEALRHYFPQSQEVYGCVSIINRAEVDHRDVLVDRWPDFSVLLVKPKWQQKPDFFNDVSTFTKDESCLRNILTRTDVLDWKQFISLSIDLQQEEMLKAVALNNGVPMNKICTCHVMCLEDPSNLPVDKLSIRVSSVKESHVALINSTWKFGMGEFTEPLVRSMILNYPSCCVLDSEGQPVSWILTYSDCAMGVLYTLPEHRRKGYGKALITILAKKLHSEGYPVYCFVEEENQLSYRLFKGLGFTEDLSYRNSWFYVNQ
ncbi:glycine N-acyltransferase-like protein 3 isoform X2 [Ictalurus furcatus]|uniref:glycine N-acyltransferase-like protein 3 isoform X2 n=1 Tax=Ictalurus furcatus TaxID=66913 RepID=UPI002350437D|nr:glycine N-acyltransferase-like protein 3 isoform X2 [Ictalurus furcatus]XP_053476460.1 glycine N-acyltransferase-like protein 3 isoform X2 [Ictalurus furcatus]XP_053476461.1 glycine N-acyltransferase-like protein 3 isoform X2 [Ictalurus furcatus]